MIAIRKSATILGATLTLLVAGAAGAQAADLSGVVTPAAPDVVGVQSIDDDRPGQGKRFGYRYAIANGIDPATIPGSPWADGQFDPSMMPSSQWVDADGDGVCDNCTSGDCDGVPALDGTGMQNGRANRMETGQIGPGFTDADGDGVCDTCTGDGIPNLDGTGMQNGRNR